MANLEFSSDRLPWDFTPGIDTKKSYEAFVVYRDLGRRRSLDATAKTLQKQCSLMYRWSQSGQWIDRAHAYDLEMEQAEREINERQRLIQHKNNIERYRQSLENLGWLSLDVASHGLEICANNLAKYKADDDKLKPIDVKALASVGVSAAEIAEKLLAQSLGVTKLLDYLEENLNITELDDEVIDISAKQV